MPIILSLDAKCSDMCSSELIIDGEIVGELQDYAPYVNGLGGGDYVRIKVDLETGQIVNWKKPSEAEMAELKRKYKKDDEDE